MDFRKTKEYIPSSSNKQIDKITDPNHEYMFYDIKCDLDKISKYKTSLINLLLDNNTLDFYKVISNNEDWFYKEGLYNNNDKLFELALIKTKLSKEQIKLFIKDFIIDNNPNHYKVITDNNDVYYIYTPSSIDKQGKTYITKPVIEINSHLYSLIMLLNRKFTLIKDTKDITLFKTYFKVSDIPYAVKNEYYLESKLKNNEITVEEYKTLLNSYQTEEEVVKLLKKN